MRVHYLNHACLAVEGGSDRVLTDPWFNGPAYLSQWHPRPAPETLDRWGPFTAVLISHGHEDHLHVPSLKCLPRDTCVYVPAQSARESASLFTHGLGFEKASELKPNRTIKLEGGMRLTPIPVGHDSIFVHEVDGKTVANINDALHAAPVGLIEQVCALIRRRFKKIDLLFCGYGGASYFPNCFALPGKDDMAVARLREAYFARNFCLIAHLTQPRFAVPFAADFELRGRDLEWINASRFDRDRMPDLFQAIFPDQRDGPVILPLQPGQSVSTEGIITGEPIESPHPGEATLPPARSVDSIAQDYAALLGKRASRTRFPAELLPVYFTIKGQDGAVGIALKRDGNSICAEISAQADPEETSPMVEAKASAAVIDYLLQDPWHSDVIIIGYGMQLKFRSSSAASDMAVEALGNLVTDYPRIWDDLVKHPLHTLKWAAGNQETHFRLKRRFGREEPTGGFKDSGPGQWLSSSPEILAQELGIPDGFF